MNTSNGGLGRGLAAIFTRATASDDDSLRGRFVESALTSLNSDRTLQLSGYIHDLGGDVTVTLRSPQLDSLHPTAAYQLFTNLERVSALPVGPHKLTLGSWDATVVVTETDRSRGLFFFGDPAIDSNETERLVRFCTVYAPVIHDHDRPVAGDEKVRLVLDQQGSDAHAEVTVGARVGTGSSADPHQAVARAALGAMDTGIELVEVGEVRSDAGSAFIVAAENTAGVATGAAEADDGDNIAVAVAALRAARALVQSG